MDYKDTQTQKDIAAQRLYQSMKNDLTPEQRNILFDPKTSDAPKRWLSGGGKTNEENNSNLQIIQNSNKQEPNAKKLYYDENGSPDVVSDFDYDHFDSRADIIKEVIRISGSLEKVIQDFVFHDLQAYSSKIITNFANLIIGSDNPKLELISILKASGITNEEYSSGETLGKQFQITRQAISKKLQKYKSTLNFPQETRDSKSASSRNTYKESNHRNNKLD